MNEVFTVDLLTLQATPPRAKQWHAAHGAASAIVVVEFADDAARQEFLGRPGVVPWPEAFDSGPIGPACCPPDFTQRWGLQPGNSAAHSLAQVRVVHPLHRWRFD